MTSYKNVIPTPNYIILYCPYFCMLMNYLPHASRLCVHASAAITKMHNILAQKKFFLYILVLGYSFKGAGYE